jgi:catechol 2,3-dioxygenase-like lactoylglutathione lyase family enzyme
VPGCGDLCFVWDETLESLLTHLSERGVEIVKGPVETAGGREQGNVTGLSVYIRDPDSNLLEFIIYP